MASVILVNIGSGKVVWHKAITCTSANLLLIEPYFSDISNKI